MRESNLIAVQHSHSSSFQPKFRTSRELFFTDGKTSKKESSLLISFSRRKGRDTLSNKGRKTKLVTIVNIPQQIFCF